jgi:hypothetical protein
MLIDNKRQVPVQYVDCQVFMPMPVKRRFTTALGDDFGQRYPAAGIDASQDNPARLRSGKQSSDSCMHACVNSLVQRVELDGAYPSLILGDRIPGID